MHERAEAVLAEGVLTLRILPQACVDEHREEGAAAVALSLQHQPEAQQMVEVVPV